MRQLRNLFVIAFCFAGCQTTKTPSDHSSLKTFCNPINLSYRFCIDEPSRREAADPSVVWFKDRYFLFVSKSGGYWHSQNLTDWIFIVTSEIPTEEYAPTAIVIEDTIYFLASSNEKSTLYKSSDPLSGKWSVVREELETPIWDPAFFFDEDERLYLYWGCSNAKPLYGVELDYKNNFSFIGKPSELIHANPGQYGWEVPGDYNTMIQTNPWIEGAWMNKYQGKYYLQYAGPGTEYKSYADAVYVSDSPLGTYTLQPHNPFSYRPEGFAAGAGHGSTFSDPYGNYWHIGTITISQKHMFERRLGLYPTFFDEQGTLHSITKYADYPMIMPQKMVSGFEEIFPGWMLLSYDKKVEVSSSVDSLPSVNITDEDIRTYWAAKSGNPGEFAMLDLGNECDVFAVQINFAEDNTKIFGRTPGIFHKYAVEYSSDNNTWTSLTDQSDNQTDNSHIYIQLPTKISCRYLKINNVEVPGGNFAISGFRVFGNGNGEAPEIASNLTATRNPADKRKVSLSWNKSENADGYNISFGIDKNRLYHSYMVYKDTTLTINSLNAGQDYYFSIESFNGSGITKSMDVILAE